LPANFALYLAAKGQFASRGLLAPDQCGYGGSSIGHAFDDNEIVGDHCAEGSAELRFTPQIEGKGVSQIQPFISFDAGAVWNDGPAEPGTYSHATGDSVGAGLRGELFHEVQFSVEYDKPIGRDVALEGNRNGRLFFFVGAAW
jgi:hemolysin activation/secretion protein